MVGARRRAAMLAAALDGACAGRGGLALAEAESGLACAELAARGRRDGADPALPHPRRRLGAGRCAGHADVELRRAAIEARYAAEIAELYA